MALKFQSFIITLCLLLPSFAAISCKDTTADPELSLYGSGKLPFGVLEVTTYSDPTPIAEWWPTAGDRFAPNAGIDQTIASDAVPGIIDLSGLWAVPYVGGEVYNGSIPTAVSVLNPYPNPAPSAAFFPVALPRESNVLMWITKASIPGDNDRNGPAGGYTSPAVVAIRHKTLAAGYHLFRWTGWDDAGRPVPSGYFVFSVLVDGKQYSRSFVLFRDYAELPPRLHAVMRGPW